MEQRVAYAADPAYVVYQATEPGDVMRIRREVEGRTWAAAQGLPTAETVAVGPNDEWMASRRLPDLPGESREYLAAAYDVARRIERTPSPVFRTPGATWAAPPFAVAPNVARLAAAGVAPWTFAITRAAASRTAPDPVTVHNDYNRSNVLNTGAGVAVVDWEHAGVGPRHQDFLRLLVDVADADLAFWGWELVLSTTPRAEHRAIARQLRWLALRTYGSEVCLPASERRGDQVARRRRRWLDAVRWTDGVR